MAFFSTPAPDLNTYFWTGAGDFDNDDNVFTWIDGDGSEVPQQMWNGGEPHNVHGGPHKYDGQPENCVRFSSIVKLQDLPCTYDVQVHYPLCEYKPN